MPCDYANYADNWKTEIRPAILKRAHHHCERCGVRNHAFIRRAVENGAIYRYWSAGFERFVSGPGAWLDGFTWAEPIRVVLTIAHLDQDRTNNDPANLAALCQRCHLRHDAWWRKTIGGK